MKTITFSSIKGGTGKSSLCILTANYAAAAGYRVLVVDLDLQNSLSSYYLDEVGATDRKNISRALHDEKARENIVSTNYMGIDLLASSFDLVKLRSISERTLVRVLKEVSEDFDFCFVDTAPTYDNLVLNAVLAADQIISPVCFSQFDYKAARFYQAQLECDTNKLDCWNILYNFYTPARSTNSNSLGNQYEDLFRQQFDERILSSFVPKTSLVRKAIDTRESITDSVKKEKLHRAIADFAKLIGVSESCRRF